MLECWYNAPDTQINLIEVLQKKVIRIVEKEHYIAQTDETFHWSEGLFRI